MDNLLPAFRTFSIDDYAAVSSHWDLNQSIAPPSTPARLRYLVSPQPKLADSQLEVDAPAFPFLAPNDRNNTPVYSSSNPSPLGVLERGSSEPYVLPTETVVSTTYHKSQRKMKDNGRDSLLTVTNCKLHPFHVFLQKNDTLASWNITNDATEQIILIGDHHSKPESTPVGLICCVALAVDSIDPPLPDVKTVHLEFQPGQLGLHIQYFDNEQAIIVTGILEGSQAAGLEKFLLGARILAVNGYAVSGLEDFGRKVQGATTANTNIRLGFFPRFLAVPGIEKYDKLPSPSISRRSTFRTMRSSKYLTRDNSVDSAFFSEASTPKSTMRKRTSSTNPSEQSSRDSLPEESDYVNLLASKMSRSRLTPPAGWEFATGEGIDLPETHEEEGEEDNFLQVSTDKVARQLQNVPTPLMRSIHSGGICTLTFANFTINYILEVFWCGYDGALERQATLVSGQSHRIEGNTGQVWVLVAMQRQMQSAVEYQKLLGKAGKLHASAGELLVLQVHRPLLSTLFGYTGMWAPTANTLSFLRRGRIAACSNTNHSKSIGNVFGPSESPNLAIHLVSHSRTQNNGTTPSQPDKATQPKSA